MSDTPALPDRLTLPAKPPARFSPGNLPWLAQLCRRAHTRFKNRNLKRIAKKPTRAVYDALRFGLGLNCAITIKSVGATPMRTFTTDLSRLHFYNAWGLYGAVYEPDVATMLDALLGTNGTFFDIGANWGYFSVRAALNPAYVGAIHAFEPMPETHADLVATTTSMDLLSQITAHRIALSNETGEAFMATTDAQHSGIARIVDTPVDTNAPDTQRVPMRRLDDLDLAPPDVIKMDVEEHEAAAIEGATNTLRTHTPFVVFENWKTPDPNDGLRPLQLLVDLGYQLYAPTLDTAHQQMTLNQFLPDDRHTLADQINVLAAHPRRASSLLACTL